MPNKGEGQNKSKVAIKRSEFFFAIDKLVEKFVY